MASIEQRLKLLEERLKPTRTLFSVGDGEPVEGDQLSTEDLDLVLDGVKDGTWRLQTQRGVRGAVIIRALPVDQPQVSTQVPTSSRRTPVPKVDSDLDRLD